MAEKKRDLTLPELLARADLVETEANVVRAIVLDWAVSDHAPTSEELRTLGLVLWRHSECTETAADELPALGRLIFERATTELLAEYRSRLGN